MLVKEEAAVQSLLWPGSFFKVITDSRKIFIMEMKLSKLNNNRLSLQVISQRMKIWGKKLFTENLNVP